MKPTNNDSLARRRTARSPRGVALFILAAIAGGALLLWIVPLLLTAGADGSLTAAERLKARNDVRTPLVAFALAVGATGTLWFTYRSHLLSRDQHTTERYTRAIDQLGHTAPEVRAGAIYALERIATDSPDDLRPIVYVLGAFLRQKRSSPSADCDEDIYAALRVATRLVCSLRGVNGEGSLPAGFHLDLRRVHLEGARLNGFDLRDARLCSSHLDHADLTRAKLDGADISSASLDHADLSGARLSGANLSSASLRGTTLAGVELRGTNLRGVDLRSARDLSSEQLEAAVVDRKAPEG